MDYLAVCQGMDPDRCRRCAGKEQGLPKALGVQKRLCVEKVKELTGKV